MLELKNSFELTSDLEQLFNSPSKHIRAALSLLYLKANNIEADENQIKFQAIIELIHNGSLIHDDIIDNSDIRRNHTTLNASHGNHLSVIAGDLVLSFALKKIAELNSGTVLKLVSDTITRMCEGEIHQYYSKYKIPTEKEYITKTYNDNETTIQVLNAEKERLADMMDKAETIQDMIAIEQRLSEVETQLNQANTTKSGMDMDIEYSTITVTVEEVSALSDIENPKDSFGSRIARAFGRSWTGFISFLQNFLLFLIRALPFLILLALLIFITVKIIRHRRKVQKNKQV